MEGDVTASELIAPPWLTIGLPELGGKRSFWRRTIGISVLGSLPLLALSEKIATAALRTCEMIGPLISDLLPKFLIDAVGRINTVMDQILFNKFGAGEAEQVVFWLYVAFGLVPVLFSLATLFCQSQSIGERFNRNVGRDAQEAQWDVQKATQLKNARLGWRIWQFIVVLIMCQHIALYIVLQWPVATTGALLVGLGASGLLAASRSLDVAPLVDKFLDQIFEERDRSLPNGHRPI
ncbi:MAG: hypothetical protein EP347_05890 [Alphaproteobacteria bacterium]|nr:MAG: hypothetical protein EP347_05890 [Alphaproteobacteria bacterium]